MASLVLPRCQRCQWLCCGKRNRTLPILPPLLEPATNTVCLIRIVLSRPVPHAAARVSTYDCGHNGRNRLKSEVVRWRILCERVSTQTCVAAIATVILFGHSTRLQARFYYNNCEALKLLLFCPLRACCVINDVPRIILADLQAALKPAKYM